jgi:hypothetical protein
MVRIEGMTAMEMTNRNDFQEENAFNRTPLIIG